MNKYVCVKNCGFTIGEECVIESELNNVIILKNYYNERNVFTKDEFDKYLNKIIIKDVNHSEKFNKLKEELENNKKYDIKNNVDYFEVGNKYYENKDYKRAIDSFKKGIKLNRDKIENYYNMAVCYSKIKDYYSALHWYDIALNKYREHNKDFYNIIFNMGFAYAMIDEIDKSLECYYKCKSIKYDEDCERAIKLLENEKEETNNK